MVNLGIDEDELASCVNCGLCLPHCPTFRVTGAEPLSPRGRISAMRGVQVDGEVVDGAFVEVIETCVQCLGCETACPSGVPFGALMGATRASLASKRRSGHQSRLTRAALGLLGAHGAVLAGARALALGQRLRVVPRRVPLPLLPLRQERLRSTGSDVWLFTGCVMDAVQRDIHQASIRVLDRMGLGVSLPGNEASCCGALSEHAGLTDQARRMASGVMKAMPGESPIVVNSAGCGAALKNYGQLLATGEAERFSARVHDICEFLAQRKTALPPPSSARRTTVAVQDPCHLRHVQKLHESVRAVLQPYARLIELDDEGLCCGAGGSFSILHGDLAVAVRELKLRAIERSGAALVVSANPGCSLFLQAAGVDVVHPVQLIDWAISGGPDGR